MRREMMEVVPSLLASDFSDLRGEIRRIERAGCRKLHLDIMDGHFVPNITFGPALIRSIRKITDLNFQAHLMIDRPERYLEVFKSSGVDGIIIHEEACCDFRKTLKAIRRLGLANGITVKPETAMRSVEDVIGDIDYLLIMTVEPGFSGQAYLEGSERKIRQASDLLRVKDVSIPIGVDGGINLKTLPRALKAGATEIIAGEAVFSGDVVRNIKALHRKAREAARCVRS